MSGESSLEAFLETHARVRESFLRHQEALLDLDFDEAARRLEAHAREIRAHIQEEEIHILPLFAARAGVIEGGAPEQFGYEHRKIEKWLEEFHAEVQGLRGEGGGGPRGPAGTDPRRRVITLLEREAVYKHLLHHHDLRERNVLYPVLDRVTTAEERRRILADIAGTHG